MLKSKQIRHNTFPDVTLLSDAFDHGVPAEEVQAQQKSMPAASSRGGAGHAEATYPTVYYSGSCETKAFAAAGPPESGRQNSAGDF